MERFEVKRGLLKQVRADGGLGTLASAYFDQVDADGEDAFTAVHGIMTRIQGSYDEAGRLAVDVDQRRPDFDDEADMAVARGSRRRWSAFLDAATGHTAKQRGDKAKEAAKRLAKAQSAVNSARKSLR